MTVNDSSQPNPRRLIVDTDTGVDDAIALLFLLAHSEVTVEGVTIVAGNAPFDRQVVNAKHVIELAEEADRIDVYEGAREPLRFEREAAALYGPDGLSGLRPEPAVASAPQHGAEFIASTARDAPGEIGLLCLGPLTNVALALDRNPNLGDHLSEVWVMGGTTGRTGNVTEIAEFNFWTDPHAAAAVLDAVDVTLVPWEVCRDAAFLPGSTIDRLADREDAWLTDFLARITERPREATREAYGQDGLVLADPLTAIGCVDRTVVRRTATHAGTVDRSAGHERGALSLDAVHDASAPRITLIEDADPERFRRLLVDTFGQ
jgi:purine nucleosidase